MEEQKQKIIFLHQVDEQVQQLSVRAMAEAGSDTPQEASICENFNIVHTTQGIKSWKSNHNKTSGVVNEETAFLNVWIADTLPGSKRLPCVDVGQTLAGGTDEPCT